MKHRLQTLLKHKLQWLVLLTALLGVSQWVLGYQGTWLVGSWDNHSAWTNIQDNSTKITLTAGTTYSFDLRRKWDDDQSQYHQFGCENCNAGDGVQFNTYYKSGIDNKVRITATTTGEYEFKRTGWSGDAPQITVYFPAALTDHCVAGDGDSNWLNNQNWNNNYDANCLDSNGEITFYNVPYKSGGYTFAIVKKGAWSPAYRYAAYSTSSPTSLASGDAVADKNDEDHNVKITLKNGGGNKNITIKFDGTHIYVITTAACTKPTAVSPSASSSSVTLDASVSNALPSKSVTLSAGTTGGSGFTYSWSVLPTNNASFYATNVASPTLTFTREGQYTATLAAGCSSDTRSGSTTVTVLPNYLYIVGPLVNSTENPANWDNGESLTRTVSGSDIIYTRSWTSLWGSSNTNNKMFGIRHIQNYGGTAGSMVAQYSYDSSVTGVEINKTSGNITPTITYNAGDILILTVTYKGWNSTQSKPEYTYKLEKCVTAGVSSDPSGDAWSGCGSSAVANELSVVATGTSPSYQWHVSSTNNFTPSDGTAIDGATEASYTPAFADISGGRLDTDYYYKCVVSVACGGGSTATSTQSGAHRWKTQINGCSISADESTVCSGTTVTFTFSGAGGVTKILQKSTNGGSSYSDEGSSTTENTLTDAPTNINSANATVKYRAMITAASGCVTYTEPVDVTVKALPRAGSNAITFNNGNKICFGTTTTATAPSDKFLPDNTSVSWTSQDADILTIGSSTGAVSTVAPGATDIVCHISGNGCPEATKSATVAVMPMPTTSITGADYQCVGTSATYDAESEAKSVTIGSTTYNGVYSYSWSVSGTGWSRTSATAATTPATFSVGSANGTITLIPTLTTSGTACTGTSVTKNVTVNATSAVGSISGAGAVCYNVSGKTLTLGSKTGDVTKWEKSTTSASTGYSDVANTTTTLSTGNLTQQTWYRVVVKSGVCDAVTSDPVTVPVTTVPAQPTFTSGDATVCSGVTGKTYTVSGTSGATYQWTATPGTGWTRTDSGTGTSATYTIGTANGTITATPKYTANGITCTGTAQTKSVTVNTTPTISLSGSGAKSATATYPWEYMTITATTTPSTVDVTWTKTFTGGSEPANSVTESGDHNHTYKIKSAITASPNSDHYTIKANGSNSGCAAAEAEYNVYINAAPAEVCN